MDDLQDAADFYEMQQAGLGGAFLHALDEGLARIQDHPKSYCLGEDGFRTAFLHRFPYGVRFRLVDDRIEIIAVWHERRDPEGWKGRAQGDY